MAVGYLRCSTDRQDDSIEQQKKEISRWSKAKGFIVIQWITDEGKSGVSFDKRQGFMHMVRCVESNPLFKYILVYDESRWGRAVNPRESTYWKMHFDRFGIKVIIINSGSSYQNTIGDFVIEVVESAEASEYSKKLSRAVLRGSKANANKGFSSGGFAPYGYKRQAIKKATGETRRLESGQHAIPKEEKVSLVLGDMLEVEVVKRIFKMKSQGYGYKRIAYTLNSDSVPCPKRGRWRNLDQKWAHGTIRSIIKNRTYCGDRVYNVHPQSHLKYSDGKEIWINPEEEWIITENVHPAIIDKSLFTKVNSVNSKSFKGGAKQSNESSYLLSGLIKCDHCGFKFHGVTYKRNNLSYYIDGGFNSKGKSVCESLKIPKNEIEQYAIKSIGDSIGKSDILKMVKTVIEKKLAGKSVKNTEKYSHLLLAIQEDERKRENLLTALENGIPIDSIVKRLDGIEKHLERLNIEKEKLESNIVNKSDIEKLAQKIDQLVSNFNKLFKAATTFEKKRLLSMFIDQIVIKKEAKIAQFYIRKIPAVNDFLRRDLFTVSSVAEEGLEPPTRGL